jgi:hypothetical protein
MHRTVQRQRAVGRQIGAVDCVVAEIGIAGVKLDAFAFVQLQAAGCSRWRG